MATADSRKRKVDAEDSQLGVIREVISECADNTMVVEGESTMRFVCRILVALQSRILFEQEPKAKSAITTCIAEFCTAAGAYRPSKRSRITRSIEEPYTQPIPRGLTAKSTQESRPDHTAGGDDSLPISSQTVAESGHLHDSPPVNLNTTQTTEAQLLCNQASTPKQSAHEEHGRVDGTRGTAVDTNPAATTPRAETHAVTLPATPSYTARSTPPSELREPETLSASARLEQRQTAASGHEATGLPLSGSKGPSRTASVEVAIRTVDTHKSKFTSEPLSGTDVDTTAAGRPGGKHAQRVTIKIGKRSLNETIGGKKATHAPQPSDQTSLSYRKDASEFVAINKPRSPPEQKRNTGVLRTVSGNRSTRSIQKRESGVRELVYHLSDSVDRHRLMDARDKFADQISLLEEWDKETKQMVKSFSREKVEEITNYFFAEMYSERTITRVNGIMEYYSRVSRDGSDKGVAARADEAAKKHMDWPELHHALLSLANSERAKASSNNRDFSYLEQVRHTVELANRLEEIRALIEQNDVMMATRLKSLNLETYRGGGHASLIIQYMCHVTGLKADTLQAKVQSAIGVSRLASDFGDGILCLLPTGSMSKLNRYGNARMQPVYAALREHTAFMIPFFAEIDKHIYKPITTGAPLHLRQDRLLESEDKPLLNRIIEVIDITDEPLCVEDKNYENTTEIS